MAKTEASGSSSSKSRKSAKPFTSTSGGTPKPISTSSKKSPVVESNEVEADGPSQGLPTKKNRATAALETTKKTGDRVAKPSTSKDRLSESRAGKSSLTAAKSTDDPSRKSTRMKQKAVTQPVEADSEESEEEWVGFEGVNEEGDEEDEGGSGEEDRDSDDEELLHGLSSDDDQDSSDEEVEFPGIDVSKLPTVAKDDKTVMRKLEKAKLQPVCVTSNMALLSTVILTSRFRRRLGTRV